MNLILHNCIHTYITLKKETEIFVLIFTFGLCSGLSIFYLFTSPSLKGEGCEIKNAGISGSLKG